MHYQTLLTELTENILTITINRPDKLNALNKTTLDELSIAMKTAYEDASVAAVIITGSGAKAFVAGADIAEFSSGPVGDPEAPQREHPKIVGGRSRKQQFLTIRRDILEREKRAWRSDRNPSRMTA